MTTRAEQETWIKELMGWGDLQLAKIALAIDLHELVMHTEMKTRVDSRNRKGKRKQIEEGLTQEERMTLGKDHLLSQAPHSLD